MTTYSSVRWKRALCEINYENWRSSALYHSSRTLLDLCCHVIVQDASFTRTAIAALPSKLYYSLMCAAIERGRDLAVKVLLEVWPSRSLSVSVLTPHYHRSGRALYDWLRYSMQLEKAVRLTSLLIRTFIQLVQDPGSGQTPLGRLKILDLTGFPVVEPVLQLVLHTIAKRRSHYDCLKCSGRQLELDNPEKKFSKRLRLSSTESANEPYVIRMDCFIRNDSILDEFHRALTMCHTSTCHLKLEVAKIDAVCLGERPVAKLLKLLDPEMIQGMGLEYNAFCNEGLIRLGLQISKFSHLKALDLSCNNLKFSEDGLVCSSLGQLLQSLPKLGRLDLSNNKLSGALASLLSHITESHAALEYLKLSACQLKQEDVEYLSRCPYVGALRELDLSENSFSSQVEGVIRLLASARNSLQVLELEDCGFTGTQLPYLVGSICHLWGLRYLNIARNRLTMDDLCEGLPELRTLPHLECVRLSSTRTWLDRVGGVSFGNEREKRRKVERVVQEGGTKRIPVLVVWDDQCVDGLMNLVSPTI